VAPRRTPVLKPLVIDASAAAAWLLPDAADQRSSAILELVEERSSLVPGIWWFEIRNILLTAERKKRTTSATADELLQHLEALPIELESGGDSRSILEFARRHNLTFYDASYLELAVRRKLGLATLDKGLVAAARRENIVLLG
jgi:predicted nucleic acid-binding protein